MQSQDSLRRTFGEVAELYDRARPGYPDALFDDLASLAELEPGARVLEIGCGTGKATVAFAQRGYRIQGVELSDSLAAVARRNLRSYSAVAIETGNFDEWPLPAEPFDAVVVAQAFHWLDPTTRAQKVADALRPGGHLAVFGHQHVAGGDNAFFVQVQDCYERFMPGTPPGLRLTEPDAVPYEDFLIGASGLFEPPVFRRYGWEQTYSTAEYLDVLRTYSGHVALAPEAQAALFRCIAHLIDRDLGGRVRKAYQTELLVARKRG